MMKFDIDGLKKATQAVKSAVLGAPSYKVKIFDNEGNEIAETFANATASGEKINLTCSIPLVSNLDKAEARDYASTLSLKARFEKNALK